MTLNVIDTVNSGLKFLHRQSRFLTRSLRKILCNSLIQPIFFIMPAQLGFQIFQKKKKPKKKQPEIKASSNAKQILEALLATRQNVKNLRIRVSRIKLA